MKKSVLVPGFANAMPGSGGRGFGCGRGFGRGMGWRHGASVAAAFGAVPAAPYTPTDELSAHKSQAGYFGEALNIQRIVQ